MREGMRERYWTQTLHARSIPADREKKLYMNKKPSIILISTSETNRSFKKVRYCEPSTTVDYFPKGQYS